MAVKCGYRLTVARGINSPLRPQTPDFRQLALTKRMPAHPDCHGIVLEITMTKRFAFNPKTMEQK